MIYCSGLFSVDNKLMDRLLYALEIWDQKWLVSLFSGREILDDKIVEKIKSYDDKLATDISLYLNNFLVSQKCNDSFPKVLLDWFLRLE